MLKNNDDMTAKFQSTHPVRGATRCFGVENGGDLISIHAPREGCDCFHVCLTRWTRYFNPRTP